MEKHRSERKERETKIWGICRMKGTRFPHFFPNSPSFRNFIASMQTTRFPHLLQAKRLESKKEVHLQEKCSESANARNEARSVHGVSSTSELRRDGRSRVRASARWVASASGRSRGSSADGGGQRSLGVAGANWDRGAADNGGWVVGRGSRGGGSVLESAIGNVSGGFCCAGGAELTRSR